ncbi:PaaI family thioesterase [Candidatus Pelagibacter sp.]|nr:PaaI family thioesterase [Candidatus Pelagibacter sp.]
MSDHDDFKQISLKQGFMKHNGGLLFRNVSQTEYEFKSTINENHLNAASITHGGYIAALIDAGAGTSAHRASNNAPCVTISLDLKFIGVSKVGDEIIGKTKILKKTNTLIFLFCELFCSEKIIASASGIWKILKVKPSNLGPGG